MHRMLIIFVLASFICGCTSIDESAYFNGTIKVVSTDSIKMKKMTLQEVSFDHPMYDLYIYDSLIINSGTSKDYNFNIININSDEDMGYFCPRGNAKNEILATTPISHIFKENGEIKTILVDPSKKSLYKWNITKSIDTKFTVFDTIIDFRSTSKYQKPYHYIEYVNDSTLLTYIQSFLTHPFQSEPELSLIELRALNNELVYQLYNIFKKTFKNEESTKRSSSVNESNQYLSPELFYASRTSVRPDKKFIVQSMLYLGQLNLIHLETNQITGIRIKETPDLSIFNDAKKIENFYFCGGLWTTNDRIFVGYSGQKEKRSGNVRYMYEFDWTGEILNIYDIGQNVDEIIYDRVNDLFYFQKLSEEKLLSFDLNDLR